MDVHPAPEGEPARGVGLRHRPVGDEAVTIELGDRLDAATSARAAALATAVLAHPPVGLLDAVATMASILVRYDPDRTSLDDVVGAVGRTAAGLPPTATATRRVVLPACYAGDGALDLAEVATRTGLTPAAVVALHTHHDVVVHMVGFLPGYAYMGPVPAGLRLPRRTTPRVRVPARSVAVAGPMTAVYPTASPGGWHVLGTVPVDLFDVERDPPALLAPGDRVRFAAVDRTTHDDMRADWRQGRWAPTVEAVP